MQTRQPAVYILANRKHGALYAGTTSNLVGRVYQHRTGATGGFTSKYRIHRLVYFELHDAMDMAIRREKVIKHWTRARKVRLIEQANPEWRDLYDEICR